MTRANPIRAFLLLILLVLVMGLTACGGAPKKASMEVRIAASADLNPDVDARPSPIILHILELTAIDEFNRADYFALTQDDASALGGDVLNKTEIILTPGATQTATLVLDDAVGYLGLVAGYRDIDSSRWRISQAVRPGQTNWIGDNLGNNQISIDEVR
jgi:type VI secretion system protein VasD